TTAIEGLRRDAAGICRPDAVQAARAWTGRHLRFLGTVRRGAGSGGTAHASPRRLSGAAGRSPMIINQWVPAAHQGDAIGDSARRVRDLLRRMGYDSDLYAMTIDDQLRDQVRRFEDPAARRGDITIFHYALPSPMTEAFASLRHGGRILQYHNVT